MHNWREKKISKEKRKWDNFLFEIFKFHHFTQSYPAYLHHCAYQTFAEFKEFVGSTAIRRIISAFVSFRIDRIAKKKTPPSWKRGRSNRSTLFFPLFLSSLYSSLTSSNGRELDERGQRSSGNRLDKLGQLIINGREIQAIENQPRLKFN